jgi:peptide/nickel transport system substrate-binding protein
MSLRYTAAVITAAAMLGLAVSGCGTSSPAKSSGAAVPATVRIAVPVDWDTLDPQTTESLQGAQQIINALYDTLVTLSPAGTVLPNLASSWTVDPTTLRFVLRTDATCDNGQPLTATDVAASFRSLASPKTAAPFVSRIFGPAGLKSAVGDDGDHTLTLTLNQPFNGALQGLSETSAAVVCPAGLENPKAMATEAFGSGPYVLIGVHRGDYYVLQRRSHYAILPPGTALSDLPKTLIIQVVSDPTTVANLLLTGQINIGAVIGEDIVRMKGQGFFELVASSGGADGLVFNHSSSSPGSNELVRRALEMTVNPADYVTAATFNIGSPIDTLYTPNMQCYNPADGAATPKYDPAGAKKLLAEAGYHPGPGGTLYKDGRPLTIRIIGYTTQNSGPAYLQSAFDAIGVHATLTDGSYDQAIGILFGGQPWDAVVYPFDSPSISPALFVNQTSGKVPQTLNVQGTDNATYNALVPKAMAASGPAACKLWDQAERALQSDADILPLVNVKSPWFGKGVRFTADYWMVNVKSIRGA